MKRSLLLLCGLPILFAAPAHADSDDVFINTLEQHGMVCGGDTFGHCTSDADLIAIGRLICKGMDTYGVSPAQAAQQALNAGNGYLSAHQAAWVVTAAIYAYCPWDEGLI